MGDPKYPRRVWRKPKRPLNYELKMEELKTLGTFGLRTKRELWKAHTELSRVRHQARSLLALRQEVREEKEPILMRSLERIGLVRSGSTLDDVLNLNVDDLLARRLQTIVANKLGFKTPYQARQAVCHGHIMIGERKVDIPSYTVTVDEEPKIRFAPESKMPQILDTKDAEEPKGVAETGDAAGAPNAGGEAETGDAAAAGPEDAAGAPNAGGEAESKGVAETGDAAEAAGPNAGGEAETGDAAGADPKAQNP